MPEKEHGSSAEVADPHPVADAAVVSGHTAGPWRTNGCYISSNYGEVGHAYYVSSMPDGMSEANACLLAAAPELLAALASLVSVAQYGGTAPFIQGELQDACAAIAKATSVVAPSSPGTAEAVNPKAALSDKLGGAS